MIRAFGSQIQHAEIDDSLKSVISRWMNIDEIMAYVAVDRMIRVDDGPFHWYCGGGGCSSHNYYWYEEPSQGTMHLIPWDLDNAFENIVFDKNPVTPIADEWGQIRSNCQPFRYGTFNLTQKSAACDKLIAGWVLFEEELIALQAKFRNGPFLESSVNALLDEWTTQIRSSTKEASEMHGDAVTESQWDAAVQELKSGLEFARNQ